MSRTSRRRVLLRHIVTLVAIPLFLSGTTYALLSQNLAISGTTTDPVYVATQYLFVSYVKTVTNYSGKKRYSIATTVRNKGAVQITSWQVKFDMPPDWTTFVCPSTVVCTSSGVTETIVNGTANATINAGSTRTFTFTFLTAVTDYTLQNVYVSGNYIAGFQTITNLTVSRVQGTRTKVGSVYQWPVTFTVRNSSTIPVSSWQIIVPWTTARTVISMPAGVTYTTNATQLLITSTQPLANGGATYVFTPTLGSTSSTWTISATVKGQP